jgi:hypothetical protein
MGFVGMRFQYRISSALVGGVGEDAAYVATETVKFLRSSITATVRQRQSDAWPERMQFLGDV